MDTMKRLIALREAEIASFSNSGENLENCNDDNYDVDDDRPVFIEPGLYSATMVNWNVGFNPVYKKSVLTMRFQIGDEVISGWFNVEPSNATTTVKAGWKSNFLRMYQECFDIRLPRRDRIPMSKFNDAKLEVEVITIGRDGQQKELGAVNHYSRVKWVHKVL